MSEEIEFIKQEVLKLPLDKNNHRRYPTIVKFSAVKLMNQGMSAYKIAAATGIHQTTLHYWQSSQKPKSKSRFKEVEIKSEPAREVVKNIEVQLSSGGQIFGLSFSQVSELLKMELLR